MSNDRTHESLLGDTYKELLDATPVCIKVFDPNGNLVFINKGGREEHHIKDTDDITKWDWRATVKERYLPVAVATFERALKGENGQAELEHIPGTGHSWCSCVFSAIKDDSGKVLSILMCSTNISKEKEIGQRKIEEELRAKAKDEALLASMVDPMLMTNAEGIIISFNSSGEMLTGLTTQDYFGKKDYDVIKIYDKDENLIPREKLPSYIAYSTGKTISIGLSDFYFLGNNDGSKVPVTVTATPVLFEHEIIATITVFHDVTKDVELNKQKDEFISLASHQFKTPLTAISWNLEMFLNGDFGMVTDEQKAALETIKYSCKNMRELVSGFLDVTKVESSEYSIESGNVDILQIADSVLQELAGQISTKKINVIKKYGDKIPNLTIGEKTARIILQNLLTNAVKYTPENGTVELLIEKTIDGISISVKDSGYGIPENAKGKIFTKLFRADNVLKKEPSGTGLGLYLLKTLVDKLGGKVWFESKEGSGTSFYVTLKSN
jgi:PAS domain S-box-containing protein